MTEIKNYTNLQIDKLDNSEIEIRAQISEKEILKYKERAIKQLSKNIKIDGFREGHIPEKILLNKIGEQIILEEQTRMALADIYPEIIKTEKLNVIGKPEVIITKLAPNNPVEFKIKTALVPEVILPDYKKISSKIEKIKNIGDITEKELEETLEQIKKGIAGKEKNNGENPPVSEKIEFTDEFVKTLGDFKDFADFKTKIKENLIKEKTERAKEKRRLEIIENIIKESEISIPKIIVEDELDKMLAQFKDGISRTNIKFDEYLKKIKKNEDDLKKEWRIDAEKRAKLQLILNKIAIIEKITAPEKEIEKETKHILEHYKNAKPENVRIYIKSVLTNEKVFQLLENF